MQPDAQNRLDAVDASKPKKVGGKHDPEVPQATEWDFEDKLQHHADIAKWLIESGRPQHILKDELLRRHEKKISGAIKQLAMLWSPRLRPTSKRRSARQRGVAKRPRPSSLVSGKSWPMRPSGFVHSSVSKPLLRSSMQLMHPTRPQRRRRLAVLWSPRRPK